LLMVLKLATGQ